MIRAVLLSCLLLAVAAPAPAQSTEGAATELAGAIARLSALDYSTRMNAARTVRRATAADAVRALTVAVRESPDQFVRYRALVLLTGFSDRSLSTVMRSLLDDRNDRVREVAYNWIAAHPDREMTFPLLAALEREQAEFVRPALVKALATLGADPAVQRALVAEVGRGLDFFRIAVIESLGQAGATYARGVLTTVAGIDGPLQDDAILALGRVGDTRDVAVLSALMLTTVESTMARHAALCLLGESCTDHVAAIRDVLTAPRAGAEAIRAALMAAGAVAEVSPSTGYAFLLDASRRPATHDLAAIVFGGAALRRPEPMLTWLIAGGPADRVAAVEALQFAFGRLEDDFAQEGFFAAVRARYWQAPEGSSDRALMAELIQQLSF